MRTKSIFAASILGTALLLGAGPAFATPFEFTLTVTGGNLQGVNGTPDEFFGSFDIDAYTGVGIEEFNTSAEITNFEITFNNVWDAAANAGAGANVSQVFMLPFNDAALFKIFFDGGAWTTFSFVSLEFAPLDLRIDAPLNTSGGADWDLIVDSSGEIELFGTLSVTALTGGGGGNQIPEPGTFAIVAMGLTGLFLSRRRRFSGSNGSNVRNGLT